MAIKLPDNIPPEALVLPTPVIPSVTHVEHEKATPPGKKQYDKKVKSGASLMLEMPSSSEVSDGLTNSQGKGFIQTGNEVANCTRFRTGMFEFDLATGGGIPRGRVTIIYGPESSGKTNAAFNAIREVQKLGLTAVYVDLESTFDPKWVIQFGVDLDRLIVVKPAYGEEAVDAVNSYMRTKDIGIVVVDSIAATVAANEIEKSTETADMGTSAILMRRMVNKGVTALALQGRSGRFPALVLLNQTRFKLGVMFGDPETMPGGQAIKFMASLIVRLSATNEVDAKIDPSITAWKKTTMKIKKAKIAVYQTNTEYSMAMLPMPDYGLEVGQTYSWNTVLAILRNESKLEKLYNGHYKIHGLSAKHPHEWAKLGVIEEQYLCDEDFREELQTIAISTFAGKGSTLVAEGAAK